MGSQTRGGAKATSEWNFSMRVSEYERSVRHVLTCTDVAVQRGKQDWPEPFLAVKHMQATLYLICSEMGSQSSFSRRGVECWWRGAAKSLAAKFWIFLRGWMTELGVPWLETAAVVTEPWEDIGSNTEVFAASCEKPADRTNAFKLDRSAVWRLFMTCFFVDSLE